MARKLVSSSELRWILNSELAKHDVCNDCHFGDVTPCEEDGDGCNWGDPILRCSGVPAHVCTSAASSVLAMIRAQYNLL